MKRTVLFTLAAVAFSTYCFAAPATMRVDYYHTGNEKQEYFSLDRIVIEPLPWAGNLSRTIDKTNLGKYFFEVTDAASGTPLYSRGFASVYGEWETTAEAKKMNRTFSESLRFPAVDKPTRLSLKKRDAKNGWQEIWSLTIDPKDKFISKGLRTPAGPLIKLHEAGDPAMKLDLLILGDGYTVSERPKFERDARKLMDVMFSTSPYKERKNDINVWGLSPASAQSGVSRPSTGIYRRSPVGVSYDAFDTERYMLTFENRTFRDLAANAPYEVVEIITNTETYGGGGIFNQFSTAAANNLWAPYLFIHEFSHHLAALADEYYTSDVAYLPPTEKVEPWEPNVTALLDPNNLKWKDLVKPGTPIPTPWPKEQYDRDVLAMQERRRKIRADNRPEAEMDALFKEQMAHDTAMLNSPALKGVVGAFEGANYETKGYYRPQTDCIMFTRDAVGFCAVCRRAIEQVLDLYSRP
jgi:IgA peptidase M64/peptidase M64-like protein